MKAKLLKKLRRIGRDQVHLYSISIEHGCCMGWSYGHPNDDDYKNLSLLGESPNFKDCERELQRQACDIYIEKWLANNKESWKMKHSKK